MRKLFSSYVSNYSNIPPYLWQRMAFVFFTDFAVASCLFITIYFVKELHFSLVISGILISIFGLGKVFGSTVAGHLYDKKPNHQLTFPSLFILTLCFFLLLYFKSVYSLSITLGMIGITYYFFLVTNRSWILDNSKKDSSIRLKCINIMYSLSNLGVGLSALIMGTISAKDMKTIFFLAAIILLIVAFAFLYIQKSTRLTINNPQMNSTNTYQQGSFKHLNKLQLLVLFNLFLVGILIAQKQTIFGVYIEQFVSLRKVGLLFAINPILIVILQVPLVNLVGKTNQIIVLGIGAFLMGIGLFLLIFAKFLFIIVIACIVYTLGEIFFIPIAQLLLYDNAQEEQKGRSIGQYKTVFAIAMIIGPFANGAIYDYLGAYTLWSLAGFIGIFILLICLSNMNLPEKLRSHLSSSQTKN